MPPHFFSHPDGIFLFQPPQPVLANPSPCCTARRAGLDLPFALFAVFGRGLDLRLTLFALFRSGLDRPFALHNRSLGCS